MLKILKNKLGGECTFTSFLKDKVKDDNGNFIERNCVRIVLKNKTGGRDKLTIQITEYTTIDAIILAIDKFKANERS